MNTAKPAPPPAVSAAREGVVFLALLVLGAAVRVWLEELPNFAPVAAIALFAGYYFRSIWLAAALPLGVMAASDWFIGGYDWRVMAVVYSTLALPVLFRGPLRRWLPLKQGRIPSTALAFTGLCCTSLGASILFFVTTNFAHWMFFTEEPGLAGLGASYAAAIPFFRYTLAGDMSFAFLLFGGYAVAVLAGWARESRPAVNLTAAAA